MQGNIARIVAQFKQSWSQELEDEAIRVVCREAGHSWRERELGPVTTVKMFLLQVLFGNVACNFVPHLAGKDVTGSAYCEARARLPLVALQSLLTRATTKMAECARGAGLWLGHRLLIVDGSSFSMPDTRELRCHFGQSGQQAAGLALVHFGSGLFQRVIAGPLRTHDLSGAARLHPELAAGDVLLGDRAFCSFAHLALLVEQRIEAVMRAHQRWIVDFRPGRPFAVPHGGKNENKKGLPRSRWIERLGVRDQLVEWFRPVAVPDWMSAESFAALPAILRVRELQYTLARPGFRVRQVTLVTTLLDSQRYTKQHLAEAYGLRWTIETGFDHLKTTMNMNVLRCKSVSGVMKELTIFLLVYNLVRMTMCEAARRQGVPIERISFVDALRWLATAHVGDPLPDLVINPLRPGRLEPRAVKRRPKQYPLLNQPRHVLIQQLTSQGVPD
jgi:hypothetical protein